MTYRHALFLADALKRAGVTVVEYKEWKKRGRPASAGPFDPRTLMLHHDASKPGPSASMAQYIAETGRPPGTPAPLSQLWVDTKGAWHVLASGRANHAGKGAGWGRIKKDCGNSCALGIETDHTTGEPWPPTQLTSIILGLAGLVDVMAISVNQSLCSHKEYAPGRKSDPDKIDMNDLRHRVADEVARLRAQRGAAPPKPPTPSHADVDLSEVVAAARKAEKAVGVDLVQQALEAELVVSLDAEGGRFGPKTKAAYAKWQKTLGYRGKDADGIPGMTSLTKLGRKRGFDVKR